MKGFFASSEIQKDKPDGLIPNECWKKIPGYGGYFEVSDKGRVKAIERSILIHKGYVRLFPERIIPLSIHHNGYVYVQFSYRNKNHRKQVHRLVALAFIPNPKRKGEVNHKDLNKQNNQASNLIWSTPLENTRHARENGRYPSHVMPLWKAREIKKRLKKGEQSKADMAREFGISPSSIRFIELGRSFGYL